jgi:hypothetical protein
VEEDHQGHHHRTDGYQQHLHGAELHAMKGSEKEKTRDAKN